ncbi:beta-lactamase/transpeptidase-like protein, partial [Zopfochytrium polystomum]
TAPAAVFAAAAATRHDPDTCSRHRHRLRWRNPPLNQSVTAPLLPLQAAALVSSATTSNVSLEDLAATIESVRTDWGVNGLAAAIVKDGQVVFSRGFGAKYNVSANATAAEAADAAVTNRTLFQIGSLTKAFTSFLVGLAVQDGLVKWKDRLADVWPDLKLPDPEAVDRATFLDALSHRTGLPRHDLLIGIYNDSQSFVTKLGDVTQSLEFREGFQYTNLLYAIIGDILPALSNSSMSRLLRDRIFTPLGMSDSLFPLSASAGNRNAARGFAFNGNELLGDTNFAIDTTAAAGSIVSSASDMGRWLSLILAQGVLPNGTSLISSDLFQTLVAPRVVASASADSQLPTYALGWFVDQYRGLNRVRHDGGSPGFTSQIVVFPQHGLAVVVLANRGVTYAPFILANTLADAFLFPQAPVDWNGLVRNLKQQQDAANQDLVQQLLNLRDPSKPTTLASPSDYAGSFSHPTYGTLEIAPAPSLNASESTSMELTATLAFSSRVGGAQTFRLSHWYNDTFGLFFTEILNELLPDGIGSAVAPRFFASFAVGRTEGGGRSGRVSSVSVPFEPTTDAIVFRRV